MMWRSENELDLTLADGSASLAVASPPYPGRYGNRMGSMQVATDAPDRQGVRYHGAKGRELAPWIIDHLPADHDVYDESHCGMANILLRKERSPIEAINDRSGEVVNFFRVLREAADELINAIDLTPFAWDEWKLSYQPTGDPVERARRFYVRAYLSIAGPTSSMTNPGFRRQKKLSRGRDGRKTMTAAAKTFAQVDHLWAIAERLKGVTIENEDALKHIRRYDNPRTLFYVDPPYMPETRVRAAQSAYEHEMTAADHAELLETLNRLKGMAVLSGYRCPLYDDALGHWTRYDKRVRVNGEGSAVESLWLNPAAEEALRRKVRPQFADGATRRPRAGTARRGRRVTAADVPLFADIENEGENQP